MNPRYVPLWVVIKVVSEPKDLVSPLPTSHLPSLTKETTVSSTVNLTRNFLLIFKRPQSPTPPGRPVPLLELVRSLPTRLLPRGTVHPDPSPGIFCAPRPPEPDWNFLPVLPSSPHPVPTPSNERTSPTRPSTLYYRRTETRSTGEETRSQRRTHVIPSTLHIRVWGRSRP